MYYFTYVLKSKKSKKSGKHYIGYTHRLRKRLEEHNIGMSASTKGRGPFELIYFEACKSQEQAIKREKYLKSGHGKRYLKERLGASYF